MNSLSEPIVFFGNERLATGVTTSADTLQELVNGGYNVVAVVSHNEATASRQQRELEVAVVAKKHGIPVFLPAKPAEIIDTLAEFKPMLGVLVAYGKIVPQSVIDLFPRGIVNIHPSLLPLHRGPTPLESVILDGSKKTGVSLMRLASEMDAGPVYAYSELDLQGNESKQFLADELLALGSSMLGALLPRIISGDVIGAPQDGSKATYDSLITKGNGVLDWQKPAAQLEREVRAYAEWPKSRTILGGNAVIITKAHMLSGVGEPGKIWKEGKNFGIYTTGGIFVIDSLKPAGKAEMSAEAFLAGYQL